MNDINYPHRLKLYNLAVLELRRFHAHLIMMYKILNGVICVRPNLENCTPLSTMHATRGNTFKLYKYRAKLDIRNVFPVRTVNALNSLSNDIVCCTSVISLLKSLSFLNIFDYTFLRGLHVNSALLVLNCLSFQHVKINLI